MATDKKSLKKMFPHLYKELETGDAKVPINAVRKNPQEARTLSSVKSARKRSLPPALRRLISCVILILPP